MGGGGVEEDTRNRVGSCSPTVTVNGPGSPLSLRRISRAPVTTSSRNKVCHSAGHSALNVVSRPKVQPFCEPGDFRQLSRGAGKHQLHPKIECRNGSCARPQDPSSPESPFRKEAHGSPRGVVPQSCVERKNRTARGGDCQAGTTCLSGLPPQGHRRHAEAHRSENVSGCHCRPSVTAGAGPSGEGEAQGPGVSEMETNPLWAHWQQLLVSHPVTCCMTPSPKFLPLQGCSFSIFLIKWLVLCLL